MSEWRTTTLREVLTQVKRPVAVHDDETYTQVTVAIRGRGLRKRGQAAGSAIQTKRQFRIKAGDLLVSRIDARNGGLGIVGAQLDGAIVTGDFPTFTPKTDVVLPAYVDLWVRRPAFWDECLQVSEGSTNRVRLVIEQFLNLELDLPPLSVQRAIVGAVGRIDAALAGTDRTASAADALFSALTVDLYESSDADTVRLGDVAKVTSGGTPPRSEPANYVGDIPWVKTGEVNFRRLTHTEEHISEQALASSSAKLLPVGTVLVAMYGQGATRGRVGLLAKEMATNQACAAIWPSERLDPEYLFFGLWGRYRELRENSEGSAQDNMNLSMVKDIEVPAPPIEEQRAVAGKLRALRAAVDVQLARRQALQQLRAALIEELTSGATDLPSIGTRDTLDIDNAIAA
jgi:type I restriction enzyme, S subunit